MESRDLSELEKNLLYSFKDKSLLEEALRHSSFVNEQSDTQMRDNERMEFLGDAVLNLMVSHILMDSYPDLEEGDLSRMRAGLVNETQLATLARTLNLGKYIQLGKGELLTDGHEKNSILADTLEAVIASVYLDGGFDSAFKIIEKHFCLLFESVTACTSSHDYKSQLQERVQLTHKLVPVYQVVEESGPDHDKTFKVQLRLFDLKTEGFGKSKKIAEQEAARKALEILEPVQK
jgi:ribonuclease III